MNTRMPIQQSLSAYSTLSAQKPEQDIHILIEKLKAHAKPMAMDELRPLNFIKSGERQCFLLHEGHVDLFWEDHKLVINSENSPFIFGFTCFKAASHTRVLLPSPQARLDILPLEKALEIVRQDKLWRSLSSLLVYISCRIYEHSCRMSHINSYETVRSLILEFLQEPGELQTSTPLLHYIQSRCYLSRSGIMRILSELRAGKYISIDNGILVAVQSLPRKY